MGKVNFSNSELCRTHIDRHKFNSVKSTGFSLIELLLVVGLLGVLAA